MATKAKRTMTEAQIAKEAIRRANAGGGKKGGGKKGGGASGAGASAS